MSRLLWAQPGASKPTSSKVCDRARTEALALAERAHAAGLTVAAHLLEMAAMETGVEVPAQRRSADARAPDVSS